ncbi:hypothetical protein [Pseudoflavonifractor phocaeensis]|nr:hypothetical protein [Pseudoflavonifractor phocaeensis]
MSAEPLNRRCSHAPVGIKMRGKISSRQRQQKKSIEQLTVAG